jgi:hypothetical protein
MRTTKLNVKPAEKRQNKQERRSKTDIKRE